MARLTPRRRLQFSRRIGNRNPRVTGYRNYLRYLNQPARSAIAAVASLLVARLCRLPETYWAAVTTIIVAQSDFGAAKTVSAERLAGTALGASLAALIATLFPNNIVTFGLGLFVLGIICPLLRFDKPALRFSGITLAIVMLIPRRQSYWIVAAHRFTEVSIGILVGLAITAIWPEPEK